MQVLPQERKDSTKVDSRLAFVRCKVFGCFFLFLEHDYLFKKIWTQVKMIHMGSIASDGY